MSDGPHRSLPLRPWWRRLAERADKCAFSPNEVAEALVPALEAECRKELAPTFLLGLQSAVAEPGLFGPAQALQLAGLDGQAPSGLARRVLDNVAVLSPAEAADFNCLQRALENALHGEAQRYIRQIEEHYHRNGSAPRAQHERDRLNEALDRADIRAVAHKMLQPDSARSLTRVSVKSGLDDGVRLQ